MRFPVALLCWPVLLAVSRPTLCAQAPRLEPGARIRFDAPSLGGRLTGTLVAWEPDTLVVRVDGYAQGLGLILPVDSVTRIAVLGFTGALLGTIIGSETKKATWAPVHLERLNLGPAPDGGLALGVRITF